jgi:hypothetical protein
MECCPLAIELTLTVNDPDVEDILAYVETHFPDEWAEDRASLLERAAKILRLGAEYREVNANPHQLAGLAFVADSPSLIRESPIRKHPSHSSRSDSDQAACKS